MDRWQILRRCIGMYDEALRRQYSINMTIRFPYSIFLVVGMRAPYFIYRQMSAALDFQEAETDDAGIAFSFRFLNVDNV